MTLRKAAMREAFRLFDRDLDGQLEAREIPTVLRALGLNPSEKEIDDMLKGQKSHLSYDEFERLAEAKVSAVDPVAALCAAFKNFDRDGSGTVNANELRHVLINLGEKLTQEEVDGLLKLAAPDSSGNIQYQRFAEQLAGRSK